jgi:hypothetical protein
MLSMIEKSNNAATSYQTLALLVERHCSLSYVMNSDNRFGRVGDAHRYIISLQCRGKLDPSMYAISGLINVGAGE